MKNLKPIMVENSKLPVLLSKLAPINIKAITLFPFVFSRGTMSEETKRHETIHFQQYLETGVIGFLALYLWDYMVSSIKGKSGPEAYRSIRAEKEAWDNDNDENYLENRKRWAWIWDNRD
tara:strand:+ start:4765 stop:5124 length:360 start_codon:yes stop_codon:yes gene_type:complete